MKLEVSEYAHADVLRAVRFYDSKPGRYGRAFTRDFKLATKRIAANPRSYSPAEDGIEGLEVREYFIERFEQRVLDVMSDSVVSIVAVVHVSRREGSWRRRLSSEN